MDKLNYFIGKICTVFTQPTNRTFNDEQHATTFSGIVQDIDGLGIWMLMLPDRERLAFFPVPIVGIIEEKAVSVTDDEIEEIKQTYLKQSSPEPTNLVSISGLKNLTKK